jgi:hypothetical protein
LTARTRSPHVAPRPRDERLDLDPLAGEDELWAVEDFLWTPDDEDYVGFFRALWIAVVLCVLFWIALALSGVELFRLATA